MPGPAPKPKEQRVKNAQTPQWEWTILPHEGRTEPYPALKGEGWTQHTLDWWDTVWRSPQGSQFTDDDIEPLTQIASLIQDFWETDDPKHMISISNQLNTRMDKYGFSPKGRRDLRWIITPEDAQRASLSEATVSNIRRLRAVDPEGQAN